jgi:hypothetical protein
MRRGASRCFPPSPGPVSWSTASSAIRSAPPSRRWRRESSSSATASRSAAPPILRRARRFELRAPDPHRPKPRQLARSYSTKPSPPRPLLARRRDERPEVLTPSKSPAPSAPATAANASASISPSAPIPTTTASPMSWQEWQLYQAGRAPARPAGISTSSPSTAISTATARPTFSNTSPAPSPAMPPNASNSASKTRPPPGRLRVLRHHRQSLRHRAKHRSQDVDAPCRSPSTPAARPPFLPRHRRRRRARLRDHRPRRLPLLPPHRAMKTILQKVGRVILNAPLKIFTTATHGGLRISRPTSLLLPLSLSLFSSPAARAQWQTTTYTLRGGWNALYLHGDATHATIDVALRRQPRSHPSGAGIPIPTPIQFGSSPLIPSPAPPSGASGSKANPTRPRSPRSPARPPTSSNAAGTRPTPTRCRSRKKCFRRAAPGCATAPTSSVSPRARHAVVSHVFRYFATFPAAIAANTKIYKYVGGDARPRQSRPGFLADFRKPRPHQAYWFDAAVVGNFYAPLEISPSNLSGLVYGRTGALLTVRVRNRTAAVRHAHRRARHLRLRARWPGTDHRRPSRSRAARSTPRPRPTPRRPHRPFGEVVGPQSSVELTFGLDRALR